MKHSPDQLFAMLASLGTESHTTEHAPVFTVEESRQLRGRIAGAHTKNLFLRDNKRNYYLVCLDEEVSVDLKCLRGLIGARGGLSFASPEALFENLGVTPGAVSLFAAINDKAGLVTIIIDKHLMEADVVNCHPLTNARTTSIKPDDLLTFLRATGHEPVLIDLQTLPEHPA
jgi:Ala-tRNA(Pro) deacylase